MALSTARQLVTLPTGAKFPVVGQGNTVADAEAELAAKLAVMVGTPVPGSHKNAVTLATELGTHGANEAFEDVTFTIVRNGIESTWTVANVSTAYVSASRPGYVDPTNPDMIFLVASHTDFAGNKGFAIVEGKYHT